MTDNGEHPTGTVDLLAPITLAAGGLALQTSADAMRALIKATGRTVTELLQGDDEADQMQAVAFLELHRRYARAGHLPDAGDLWDLAGAVEIDLTAAAPMIATDPLDAASSRISPPSATTGT
jgi:hypothetical protein